MTDQHQPHDQQHDDQHDPAPTTVKPPPWFPWVAGLAIVGLVGASAYACTRDDDLGGTAGPTSTAGPSPSASSASSATPGASGPLDQGTAPSRLWNPQTNVFTLDVSKAPVHQNSPGFIKNLQGQITPNYGGMVALNAYHYNPSYYVVDASTPKVNIAFYDCQNKKYTPDGLFNGPKYFQNVPIPENAIPATGTDSTLSIYSPDTDQVWELWVLRKQKANPKQWEACWGGRIDQASKSAGQFQMPFGASASGLATIGSMITLSEAKAGKIEHAMALNLIAPADWQRVWYPANRSDGNDRSPNAIPEGARLRLDPSVNVDTLKLTPLGKAVARAAQKYGFIVVDTAGAVAVIAESGTRVQKETGSDPWKPILGAVPNYKQLEGFPWDKLQVLQQDYGKP